MINFLCLVEALRFDIYGEIPSPYLWCDMNYQFREDLFPAIDPNIFEQICSLAHTST